MGKAEAVPRSNYSGWLQHDTLIGSGDQNGDPLIDCLHALEEAVSLLDIPLATDLSGGSVRSKDASGFVIGDDAEYAFACPMISLWEGARV